MSRTWLLHEALHEYKANLHAHTTRSDGSFTPEELRELYRSNGYQVLAYTDHHRFYDSSDLSDDGFLALSGYELNFDHRDPDTGLVLKTCHINAIAKDPKAVVPVPGKGRYEISVINEAVRKLKKNGFLVNLNHTSWSNMTSEDILAIRGINGMELFNSTCEYGFEGMGELHRYMQTIRTGCRVLPLAADDVHNGAFRKGSPYALPDGCRAFMMLRADELSYSEMIHALEKGHYYCSNGPRIYHAYLENGKAVIDCSPVCGVFLKTKYVAYQKIEVRSSDTITHVEFDLDDFHTAPFVLFQITDTQGRFASTIPHYKENEI